MPAALPIIGAVFLGAGAIATTIASVAAITIAGIGLATILTVTGVALTAIAFLTMKTPKPASQSQGQQLDLKLDPKAPVPVVFGRTATGGYMIYRDTFGSKNAMLAMVAVLSAGGPVHAIEQHIGSSYPIVYNVDPTSAPATAVAVTGYSSSSKLYKNKLHMRYQLGDAPASLTVTQASGQPLPGSPGKLSGLAHTILWAEQNNDAFPQGLPKSVWVLSGVKFYDPRKDSTYTGGAGPHRVNDPATWEFSENPYLAALQWTLGRYENGKRVYGIGAKWDEIDVSAFVYGANIADANGWKIGGVVTTSDDKYAVLATILQAGGGVPVPRGAQISVAVNAPKTSVFSLNPEDIIGTVELQTSTSYRDRKNTVIPSYREETQQWEVIAGEEISVPEFVADDRDQIKSFEIEFPMVQQAAQAHQLAAYELCNSREFLTFKVECKPLLLNVRVGDAMTVNLPQVGAPGQKCVVVGREYDPQNFTVSLSLKSETDAKHAYALGQSQVPPETPTLNGYDPTLPDQPGETAWFATGTYKANDNGVKLPVIVVHGASDNPYATRIVVEYRPLGEENWSLASTAPASTSQVEIFGVTAGTTYEIAVSYVTIVGATSGRRILTATAGAMEIDWNSGVITGPNKPADGATVGGTVGVDIKTPDGTIWVPPAIDMTQVQAEVEAQVAQARELLDAAIDGVAEDIEAARGRIDTVEGQIDTARTDLADEIARAAEAEGALTTAVTQAQTTADGAVTSINEKTTVLTTATTSLGNRATMLEGQMAGTGDSVLKTLITDEVTVRTSQTSALATRANTLEAQLAGTTASNLSSRISTVETATTDGRFAAASRATSLEARAGVLENQMAGTASSNLNTRLSTVETATTDGRFATASRATNLEVRAGALENQLAGTSGSSLLTRIQTVETATTDGRFAAASRATNLEAQMGGTQASNLLSRITDEATTRSGETGALATRAGNLEAKLAGTQSSSLLARIQTVETATTDGRFATASRASALESQFALGTDSALFARLRAEETARTSETGSLASRTSSLETGAGNLSSRVSTTESAISSLNGKTAAYWQVQTVAGNGRAQMTVHADANGGGGVDMVGDFRITGSSATGTTLITGNGVYGFYANGVPAFKLGQI